MNNQKDSKLDSILRKYANLVGYTGEGIPTIHTELNGECPIHIAAERGSINEITTLLANGADINSKGGCAMTPLELAVSRGRIEIVQFLVRQGADTTIRTPFKGQTPLHEAIRYGYVVPARLEAAKVLIREGADTTIQNNDGNTALHLAVEECYLELVQLLVRQGADTTIQNNDGNTPLHLAVKTGHIEAIEFLVRQGASITIKNNDGDTPFDLAKIRNEIYRFLSNLEVPS